MEEFEESLELEGWHLSKDGIKLCKDGCGKSKPLAKEIIQEALNLDLRQIGRKSLPDDINKGKVSQVNGPMVLQVQKVRNISAPHANEESSHAPRMLRLHLTDGKINCVAIEVEQIPSLSLSTPPGSKICICGHRVPVEHGFILLGPRLVRFLGGEVDKLKVKWEVSKSVSKMQRKIASGEEGPPIFIPFEQSRFAQQRSHSTSDRQQRGRTTPAYEKVSSNKTEQSHRAPEEEKKIWKGSSLKGKEEKRTKGHFKVNEDRKLDDKPPFKKEYNDKRKMEIMNEEAKEKDQRDKKGRDNRGKTTEYSTQKVDDKVKGERIRTTEFSDKVDDKTSKRNSHSNEKSAQSKPQEDRSANNFTNDRSQQNWNHQRREYDKSTQRNWNDQRQRDDKVTQGNFCDQRPGDYRSTQGKWNDQRQGKNRSTRQSWNDQRQGSDRPTQRDCSDQRQGNNRYSERNWNDHKQVNKPIRQNWSVDQRHDSDRPTQQSRNDEQQGYHRSSQHNWSDQRQENQSSTQRNRNDQRQENHRYSQVDQASRRLEKDIPNNRTTQSKLKGERPERSKETRGEKVERPERSKETPRQYSDDPKYNPGRKSHKDDLPPRLENFRKEIPPRMERIRQNPKGRSEEKSRGFWDEDYQHRHNRQSSEGRHKGYPFDNGRKADHKSSNDTRKPYHESSSTGSSSGVSSSSTRQSSADDEMSNISQSFQKKVYVDNWISENPHQSIDKRTERYNSKTRQQPTRGGEEQDCGDLDNVGNYTYDVASEQSTHEDKKRANGSDQCEDESDAVLRPIEGEHNRKSNLHLCYLTITANFKHKDPFDMKPDSTIDLQLLGSGPLASIKYVGIKTS